MDIPENILKKPNSQLGKALELLKVAGEKGVSTEELCQALKKDHVKSQACISGLRGRGLRIDQENSRYFLRGMGQSYSVMQGVRRLLPERVSRKPLPRRKPDSKATLPAPKTVLPNFYKTLITTTNPEFRRFIDDFMVAINESGIKAIEVINRTNPDATEVRQKIIIR